MNSVWRASGWCLVDHRYCQDCSNGITVDKNHFHSLHSTAAFPTDALHNANIDRFDGVLFGMSVGFLEDVWEVSWVVWVTLDNEWGVGDGGRGMMQNYLI